MIRVSRVLVVGLVVITSCGGGDTATTTAGPEPSASSTSTAAEAAEQDSGDVVAIDIPPCDLLTAEEVSSASGLTVAQGLDSPPISCIFDFGADAGVSIFVIVDDGQGRMSGPAALFESYSELGAETISDLGEAAVYSQDFRAIAVDAGGGHFVGLGVNGGYSELSEPRDVLVELARLVLGRL
jgi:hypothetical protein